MAKSESLLDPNPLIYLCKYKGDGSKRTTHAFFWDNDQVHFVCEENKFLSHNRITGWTLPPPACSLYSSGRQLMQQQNLYLHRTRRFSSPFSDLKTLIKPFLSIQVTYLQQLCLSVALRELLDFLSQSDLHLHYYRYLPTYLLDMGFIPS